MIGSLGEVIDDLLGLCFFWFGLFKLLFVRLLIFSFSPFYFLFFFKPTIKILIKLYTSTAMFKNVIIQHIIIPIIPKFYI